VIGNYLIDGLPRSPSRRKNKEDTMAERNFVKRGNAFFSKSTGKKLFGAAAKRARSLFNKGKRKSSAGKPKRAAAKPPAKRPASKPAKTRTVVREVVKYRNRAAAKPPAKRPASKPPAKRAKGMITPGAMAFAGSAGVGALGGHFLLKPIKARLAVKKNDAGVEVPREFAQKHPKLVAYGPAGGMIAIGAGMIGGSQMIKGQKKARKMLRRGMQGAGTGLAAAGVIDLIKLYRAAKAPEAQQAGMGDYYLDDYRAEVVDFPSGASMGAIDYGYDDNPELVGALSGIDEYDDNPELAKALLG